MKRRLYLLRHAKSAWDADYGDDHERPLAPRGERAAALMGRFLARAGEVPELVVTSSAVRARTTVELAAAAGDWDCPVEVTRDLYDASPEEILEVVRRLSGDSRSLLLAGHEPSWSALLGGLVGEASVRLPTAALAGVDLELEGWGEIETGAGTLRWLVTPKLLQKAGYG